MKLSFSLKILIIIGLSFLCACMEETNTTNANLFFDRQKSTLNRFEEAIQAFEKADSLAFPAKDGILFVGSSSIRFWETLAEDMTPLPVINRGFGGSTIPEVLHYADRIVFPYRPKMIVFYCGENDIQEGMIPELVFQNFKKFALRVQEELPETRLIFLSMKPSLSRWSIWNRFQKGNHLIQSFAENVGGIEYIDVSQVMLDDEKKPDPAIFIEDGLHMNQEGYLRWTGLIKPSLLEWFRVL